MKNLINQIRECWTSLKKTSSEVIDVIGAPKNSVKILFKDPITKEVVKVIKGRNIVTGYLTGNVSAVSGRDFLRRVIVNPASSDSVSGRYIAEMELGLGSDTAAISDQGLDTPFGNAFNDQNQSITTVTLSASDPDITFSATWPANCDINNNAISEVGLYSNTATRDFIARKDFPTFTKTSAFEIEIQWTLRF